MPSSTSSLLDEDENKVINGTEDSDIPHVEDLSENKPPPPEDKEEKEDKEESVTLRPKGVDKKREIKSFSAVEPKTSKVWKKVMSVLSLYITALGATSCGEM